MNLSTATNVFPKGTNDPLYAADANLLYHLFGDGSDGDGSDNDKLISIYYMSSARSRRILRSISRAVASSIPA